MALIGKMSPDYTTASQVDFSRELDALLEEVVRLLK